MNFTLKVWRQGGPGEQGALREYQAKDIPPDASFLEMLDIVNEDIIAKGEEPIEFDSDCREGICGTCSLTINGRPHGPGIGTTCQLYMRKFKDGDTIHIEPFRAEAFPVVKDLTVDRGAFDRIIAAGGYVSAASGSAPDANAVPIAKDTADLAMDAAACIGCAACVAACPNSSAMLFVGAKVTHLGLLPQGQPERRRRVVGMVGKMEEEGFGGCTNFYQCEAVCPAHIPASVIARLNREYLAASALTALGVKG